MFSLTGICQLLTLNSLSQLRYGLIACSQFHAQPTGWSLFIVENIPIRTG